MKRILFNTFLLLLVGVAKAQAPVAGFSGSVLSGCAPLSVAFKDESTGTPKFWDWEFSGPSGSQLNNLQNPVVTFSQPGTYSVTLVVRNGSGVNAVTKTDYITVYPSPSVSFSADLRTACIPAAIQFTGNVSTSVGTISGVTWEFGDGETSTQANPQHTYKNEGYYTVMLTATSSNNCTSRSVVPRYIRMVGGIEADFIAPPSSECRPPFNVNFRNESTGPGTLTYEWDLGNGSSSVVQNPSTTYSSSSTYNVRLITRSSFGCVDTAFKPVNVTSYTTDFTVADTVCIGQNINIQNTSGTNVESFKWDFGDGTFSSQVNPGKNFNTPGTYPIKLVNQFSSCADSITKNVIVTAKPVVDFTATNGSGCAAPLIVSFQNNTPATTVSLWNFGDGSTSTEQQPAHPYATTGTYNVTLTTKTSYGCESSGSLPGVVKIIPPEVSIINNTPRGCWPLAVSPTANISAIDGVATYNWDMGNGTTSTSATPTVTYGSTGVYTIRLIITTNGGCTDTATSVVRVGDKPADIDFNFDPGGVCVSDSSSFEGIATNANEWLWDFGDGATSTLQNPKHAYRDTGLFSVKLVAYNNGCAGDPVTKTEIIQKQAPVAKFRFVLDCADRRTVLLIDSSVIDPALTPLSYTWDYGDGQTSTMQGTHSHTYSSYGNYAPTLHIENGSQCASDFETTINVSPLDSTFTLSKSTICRGEQFSVNANEAETNVQNYRWRLAGGTWFGSGSIRSFDTTFNSLGDFSVLLQVTDKYGCVASSTQNVTVTGPVAQFVPSSKSVCKNGIVSFTDQSTSNVGIASWTWDFGDGQTETFTSPTAITHQYADTGTFIVKLLVRDNAQCFHEFISQDTIRVTAPIAAFSMPAKYCPGVDVPFSNNSEGYNLTYRWDFGDGQTSSAEVPVYAYAEGVYTARLVIEDDAGCKDSLTKSNVQIVRPVAAFDIIDSTSICQVLQTIFPFRGQNYESVLWDFGDGTTSIRDSTARNFYADYGSYQVKLYAYGFGGCVDSASGTVNVYNPNTYTKINYTAPPNICNEVTLDFNLEVPPNTKFYFYFGDGTIDSSGQTNLQHTYTYPRNYGPYIYLIDSTDCRVQIGGGGFNIYGAVPVFNLDRRAFCDSGTVFITNYTISNDGIATQTWNFGDGEGFSGATPQSHTFTQPGLYPVELMVVTNRGCEKTFTDTVRVPRTPEPIIENELLTCVDRLVRFKGQLAQADTAIRWAWNFGDGRTSTEQDYSITYNQPGGYNIQLTAANFLGCSGSTAQTFTVAPLPVVTTNNVTIAVGGQVQLPVSYSAGTAGYQWAPPEGLSCTDCPFPIAKPQFTQTYHVVVTDSNTCVSNAEVTVTVLCSQENYFVPNTFSPNGDGVNEIFYPRGRGLARVQSMKIFNRWGQLVFDRRNFMANDASMGWNGKAAGQPVPPDVYVYVIEFVCDNAQIVPMKGNVTLVR